MNPSTEFSFFSPQDMQSFLPAMKIGLLTTINPQGEPHISLLSSLIASSPAQLAFGQFTEGLSKTHILHNPKTAFLIMSLEKNLWRGKAKFTHTASTGQEFDFYNNIPMFRYNAYFGIHTVYYLDLISHQGKAALPMQAVIWAAILSSVARTLGKKNRSAEIMNTWTQAFMNKLDNLKFLSYIDQDGYPILIPAVQAQSLGSDRILFSTAVYAQDIKAIPEGARIAVFGMALTMEDVLLRGTYQGTQRVGGLSVGVIDVDWVYNAMPPIPGQIYPPLPLAPITDFQ
jgi:hypothetical protein